jgi:hypothetical protein
MTATQLKRKEENMHCIRRCVLVFPLIIVSFATASEGLTETRYYFEGVGENMEEALRRAHDKIPPHPGQDYTVSRVIDWGMQRGGFIDARRVWVRVIEDEDAKFKPDK